MKTIIAGSRGFNCGYTMAITMAKIPWDITEVISGKAKGTDRLGEDWADTMNIPVTSFYPDWDKYGRAAGHIRNADMAKYGQAAVIFWDGVSPGTRSMIDLAKRYKLKLHIEMV